MDTSSAAAIRRPQVRFKYILFVAFVLMFLFVLWDRERFIIDHSHPLWRYYFPVRWWLLPHGLAALTALLIGPFQFSSRFRQRHLRVHRIMGCVYLGGIAVAATIGMYLAAVHSSVGIRFYVFAVAPAWLLTAGIAFVCVRNGNIPLHRQFMVRSYAITSTFVTDRIFDAILAIYRPGAVVFGAVTWSVLVATLVLTELGLAWQGIFINKRA
jgi:uncharacterized membrane protein